MSGRPFQAGEKVRLIDRSGLSPMAPQVFRIMHEVPASDSHARYRIRNDEREHERVELQTNLEAAGPEATAGSGVSPTRTIPSIGDTGMAKGQKHGNKEVRKPKMDRTAPKLEIVPGNAIRDVSPRPSLQKNGKRK